jgi:sec-independent protein translocase protein TatB
MFEVGFTEIVLIFGIALLVLGPARLPKLAADIGRWAGRARAMARQLRSQLEQETQFDPLADNNPAVHTSSNSIHTPPAAPTPDTTPQASPETASSTASDESRATPAQLATAATARVDTVTARDEPASLDPTSDALASPAQTDPDEPKPG